jgi:hypothetical protein
MPSGIATKLPKPVSSVITFRVSAFYGIPPFIPNNGYSTAENTARAFISVAVD